MRTTEEGVQLIKDCEGCRLAAYLGPGDGIWTIAWGHTAGVKQGMTCTQAEADEWLNQDIAAVEQEVLRCVKVSLNDNQLSAIVSFCYNIGFGEKGVKSGFAVLKNGFPSTLLNLINAGNFEGAADEFPKWSHVAGQFTAGILARRLSEQDLFLKPV